MAFLKNPSKFQGENAHFSQVSIETYLNMCVSEQNSRQYDRPDYQGAMTFVRQYLTRPVEYQISRHLLMQTYPGIWFDNFG